MSNWFEIDKKGLAKLLERRGKAWLVYELVQNSRDAGATTIEVELRAVEGKPLVELTVTDDAPGGFTDLTHAWTLFAESGKKGDPSKGGKFNLGEKLVLALCEDAHVISTTGGVRFGRSGRTLMRDRRARGSEFFGTLRMTRAELAEALADCHRMIATPEIMITINGALLPSRTRVATAEVTLPTEIADDEGVLRVRERKTVIEIYEPLAGETPTLYEFIIPVVETEDRYHVAITQRVPVSLERDNVPPAYLRRLRAAVLNATASKLTAPELAEGWVTEATTDAKIDRDAVARMVAARFGTGAVTYDPSDKGSNAKALSHGVQVVHGGSLPAETWAKIREHGILQPAGQIYPDKPSSFLSCPDVTPSDDEHVVMGWYFAWGKILLGKRVHVRLIDEARVNQKANWNTATSTLTLNRAHLGESFFKGAAITEAVIALGIHEFAHDFDVGDGDAHLSAAYYEACCTIGARLALHLMAEADAARRAVRPR